MRIGIITLSQGNDNYGGCLQAFALQTALERLGHNPFFVNTSLRPKEHIISRYLEHPIREIQRFRRYLRFVDFWRKNFNMDPAGHFADAVYPGCATPTDAYVCGSDQIWRNGFPDAAAFRRIAFADFGSPTAKRIAYAPGWSCKSIPSDVKDDVRRCLSRFSSLSAREDDGVRILADLGFASVKCVVDPTLLFDAAFWSTRAIPSRTPGSLLLMTYRWSTSLRARAAVRLLKQTFSCNLVVPSPERPFEFPLANVMMTPGEWLGNIRDSRFVLTNSFHCLVFSLIFHKPFAVLALNGRYEPQNARFESLLNRVALGSRLVRSVDELKRVIDEPIDWNEVDNRLMPWQKESWDYLCSALSA